MRRLIALAATLALGTGYLACGSQSNTSTLPPGFVPTFDSDGGSGSGSTQFTFSQGSSGSSGIGGSSSSGSSTTTSSSSQTTSCTTNTGPITGSVGNSGGSISRLVFATVGDTRPATSNDTGGYPTTIIDQIFQDIEALSPHPPLVMGTGDYQFSSASGGTGDAQVQIYMQARAKYTGAFFPAMGNHECGACGSYSTSDDAICGPEASGSCVSPTNFNAFIDNMMTPIGQSLPYYSINVNASDNSWTAKFVVTAANAWGPSQQSWLTGVMAQKTTYTFVFRHEASDATPPVPTGVYGVDAILANSTYTMLIVGHAHTYGHYNESFCPDSACATQTASPAHQEVIFGNGGAPITGTKWFGFGLFAQRCDGAIVVDSVDYQGGGTDSYFHFAVTPDGALTQ